jgi:small neutral amino acid transporter SnatA (MarC family)
MEPAQYWLSVGFLVVGGAFSFVGALKDWDFFFESRRAQRLVRIIGRKGAKVFYLVVGLLLLAGGLVMLLIGPATLIDAGP